MSLGPSQLLCGVDCTITFDMFPSLMTIIKICIMLVVIFETCPNPIESLLEEDMHSLLLRSSFVQINNLSSDLLLNCLFGGICHCCICVVHSSRVEFQTELSIIMC